jgi:DNA-binding MarR family transcriptional regulator
MGLSTQVLTAVYAGEGGLPQLAEQLARDKKDIVKAAQTLKKRGLLLIAGGRGAPRPYVLTEAGKQAAARGEAVHSGQGAHPRPKTIGLRARAWWEIHAHQTVSLERILSTHASGHEKDGARNIYKYLCALEAAGILRRLERKLPAQPSRGRAQWALARSLGPKAPVYRQKANEVYDPNSGAVYPMQSATAPEKEGERHE